MVIWSSECMGAVAWAAFVSSNSIIMATLYCRTIATMRPSPVIMRVSALLLRVLPSVNLTILTEGIWIDTSAIHSVLPVWIRSLKGLPNA
jgi:hypothetical protein